MLILQRLLLTYRLISLQNSNNSSYVAYKSSENVVPVRSYMLLELDKRSHFNVTIINTKQYNDEKIKLVCKQMYL